MLYSSSLQRAAFLVGGPFGCYVVYNAAFIWRQYDPDKYAALAQYYEWPGLFLTLAVYTAAFAISVWATYRYIPASPSKTTYSSLSRASLALMLAVTAALMALTIYRVFGTLLPSSLADDFSRYYAVSRRGGAWMILAAYAILYAFLLDMYFGGVNRWNSAALLASVVLNFVTGGRSLLMCVLLAYMFLLYRQRPAYRDLFIGIAAAAIVALLSFVSVTELRLPDEDQLPPVQDQAGTQGTPRDIDEEIAEQTAEAHYEMNYNSAFVMNDVLDGLNEGRLTAYPHFIVDTMNLMPRSIVPNKPLSTSDTRAVYPAVAARGTTMSFPLDANVAMHLGAWAFILGPIVAALCQLAFVWGASRRIGLVSFLAFFWGTMFLLAARGGILNYRIVLHSLMIAVMFFAYSQVAKGFLAGWFMARQKTA